MFPDNICQNIDILVVINFQKNDFGFHSNQKTQGQNHRGNNLTPLTKLGELGSWQVYNCVLKSKPRVQVKDNIKTCYFHEGSTKRFQIMSTKSCK